jgi:hypothetical protein
MSSERARANRSDVFRIGEIVHPGAPEGLDCLVRNTSETGALIEVATTDVVPERFHLRISAHRLERACRVTRRTAHMLGVAFV